MSWFGFFTNWFSAENPENFEDLTKRIKFSVYENLPPQWIGHEELLKQLIHDIPRKSRYFDIEVPNTFQFSLKDEETHALATEALRNDVFLARRRFELVPTKMSHENFWKVYFYIIYIIKNENPITVSNRLEELYSNFTIIQKKISLEEKLIRECSVFQYMVDSLTQKLENFNRLTAAKRIGQPVEGEIGDEQELRKEFDYCIEKKKNISLLMVNVNDPALLQKVNEYNTSFKLLLSQYSLFIDLTQPQSEVKPSYIPKILNSKLPDYESTFTTNEQRAEVSMSLPIRYSRRDWTLLYSLKEHGISLNTLYRNCKDASPIIILVKSVKGNVIGCFCGESVHLSTKYYGSGESFVFHFPYNRIKTYHWTKKNDFFVHGSTSNLNIGGGTEGGPAIQLYGELMKGKTRPCMTFDSPSLISQKDLDDDNSFIIESVECYTILMSKKSKQI